MTTIADINREIHVRAKQLGLEVDCGADGIVNTKVAFVGEHPGDRERILKMPLAGASGQLLWNTLRPYGITRRSAYITNVVKRQPLGVAETKKGKYQEKFNAGEVSHYSSILLWELNQLPDLSVVVVLGNLALQAITGYTGITNYRGSVFDVQLDNAATGVKRVVKVVALLNPAAILREPKNELMFKFDCARLNQVLTGQFEPYVVEEIINPTFDEAMAWIDKMESDGLPVGCDIETSSGETICVGLANDPHTGMCINLRDAEGNRFTVAQEICLFKRLQAFFLSDKVRLVFQNGMYDCSWFWFIDRIRVKPVWFDTMLAHHTLYPIMPHNLGFLTTQYTNHPFYKDEGKTWRDGGDIDSHWRYNVKDCCIMLKCQQVMLKELEAQGMADFFWSHVMPLQPELIDMTVHGVKIDTALKARISKEMEIEIGTLKVEYYSQVEHCTGELGYRPNPNSPKQMAELFFKRLRLVGRGVATDKENRRRMREHPRTPEPCRQLLSHIDRLAEESKYYSTYVEMKIDEDGRGRTTYKQMGVVRAPGRLSSESTGWGTGGNFQNQSERSHAMFIADEGYMFSYFDLAQAEARYVGWKTPIPMWIEQFERARIEGGYDCHRALASIIFNVPYDDVPTSDWDENLKPTIRYRAKRCRHALNYRMMPGGLASELGISNAEAEYLWHLYHKATPEVQEWWEYTCAKVKRDKVLYNAFGRRWMLMERYSDEATESIIAFDPQSTIGDKVTRVIRQCHADPDWPRKQAAIRLNIHDALIAIHTHDVGSEVRRVMKKHLEEPILVQSNDGIDRELIIPADGKMSIPDEHGLHRWSGMVKIAA